MPSQSSQSPPSAGAPKPEIPDKLYFRIGEVAKLCAVPAYVLRFWEGEFTQLHPNKSGTGQRLYRRRDVETALRIKRLLYEEGYTIAGARQAFQAEARADSQEKPRGLHGVPGRKNFAHPKLPLPSVEASPEQRLQQVRTELRDLLTLLSSAKGTRSRRPARPDAASLFPERFQD